MSDVVYLYGFVPADAAAPPPDVVGVADAPVRLVVLDEVQAVVADVPGDAYAADQVESRLVDLAWVGEQGIAHERVVVWFADNSEILPARLFSLYSGDESLRAAVASRLDAVRAALRALTGKREWNLKVAYDADELTRHGTEVSPELKRMDEEIAGAAPGRRYLLERRRTEAATKEIDRAARTLADELLAALRTHAEDSRVLPPADRDEGGTVVLNAALLVNRAGEPALRTHVEDLYQRYNALGMIMSFSGPWAPYRFLEPYDDA
jgi:hypothetical protein